MRHPAKFRVDRSNRSGDIADFRFARWRPSAILDFQKLWILTSGLVRRPNLRDWDWILASWCLEPSQIKSVLSAFIFSRFAVIQLSISAMHSVKRGSRLSHDSALSWKQEIRSVEHGICPIAEFTSPWLHCAYSNRIPYPLFCWCRDVHLLLKNIKWILKSH